MKGKVSDFHSLVYKCHYIAAFGISSVKGVIYMAFMLCHYIATVGISNFPWVIFMVSVLCHYIATLGISNVNGVIYMVYVLCHYIAALGISEVSDLHGLHIKLNSWHRDEHVTKHASWKKSK